MSNNKVVVQGGVGFPGFVLSHQDTVLGSDCVYLKGEWIADPLDFLNVEQPKSYFY